MKITVKKFGGYTELCISLHHKRKQLEPAATDKRQENYETNKFKTSNGKRQLGCKINLLQRR